MLESEMENWQSFLVCRVSRGDTGINIVINTDGLELLREHSKIINFNGDL